jgi:hypothetical protein
VFRSTKLGLALVLVVSTFGTAGVAGPAHAGSFVSESDYDFDCDGIRDSVAAHEGDWVNGIEGAGKVTVTYSRDGATQEISQATPGVPGTPEERDSFGESHTAYDRNRDGCDDLVIGVPDEDVGPVLDAGAVTVIPGSETGLDTSRSEAFSQNSNGIPGTAEDWDWFGRSLAAGATSGGTPYLLIGSPGEGRESPTTIWNHGAVYYLRSGAVSVIHQDSPGVPGIREADDYFGESLAVSDRYFVVGTSQEIVHGDVFSNPDTHTEGMVHVFSHTLTSGMPTPVAAFHQDTSGISGVAEAGDRFGWSVSVLPYRPAGSTSVGALVAVGSGFEKVGGKATAGMAHLVYVSPGGSVRQLAAITQDTPGVTGAPESGDYLGYDVVVANTDPDTSVATPDTAVWAVAVGEEETAYGNTGAAHVFRATWQPGMSDYWFEQGRSGTTSERIFTVTRLRASATYLHVGEQDQCVAVPWQNIFGVEWQPVVSRVDDCR